MTTSVNQAPGSKFRNFPGQVGGHHHQWHHLLSSLHECLVQKCRLGWWMFLFKQKENILDTNSLDPRP